jgi:peptide/nickel transport system substrate-binding protein
MPQSSWIRVTAALLLAALLAACGGAPQGGAATTQPAAGDSTSAPAATEPTPAPATDSQEPAGAGAVLRIGRTAAPDSLNPGVWYLSEAYDIVYLVYDTLIATDLRNQPIPQLAREWSLADDGRTWTFTLHEGAKWHDGTPLTAEDVVFTFEMIQGFEAFGLIKDYTTLIESVEAPDPLTAVITFEDSVANTDERFSGVPILPKHIWQQFESEQAATEFENLEMIGSGPFRMTEYRPGEFTRLAAVKDHYLEPPKVDEVIFRVFGNDDAMVQALRTGEVDLIAPPETVIRTLQSEPNIKVEIGEGLSLTDIIFNVTTPENCPPEDGQCTGHPAIQDVRVRQALAHATDKQQLIDVVKLGLGSPGLGLVMPGHGEAFHAELQDYAYDTARANAILDEAGYADSDGDGVREMPGDPSKPLNFRFSYPSDQLGADGTRFAETLGAMWKEAGVELTVQPLEADALTAICCPAFDFDVILWGWGAGVDPSSLLYILTTEQIPTGVSETGYSNPEYDELFKQQEVTSDREERVRLLHQMQEIMVRDVPYIIAYYPQSVEAYRADRFQGWVIDPEGLLALSSRVSLTVVEPVQ